MDPAALAYTPLVSVNSGSHDLLLGWEVFKLGPVLVPAPLYGALHYDGPVADVVAPPRRRTAVPTSGQVQPPT
jgi:hypothetical protein